jgi:excinuclease ABC subunit C
LTTADFQQLSASIPHQPGIYKFIHPNGEILYVGKAKNLLNRLSNYFGERKDREAKTRALVKAAKTIEITIVNSEQDALLLECSLIKQHQPRYNIMLKDGKSYPYVCIKAERFPRVFMTRRVIKDGSQYFGPYTSGNQVYVIFDLIKKLFPLRTCVFDLSEAKIAASKYKVCLEYHIKNCMGACCGLETEETYLVKIQHIRSILSGRIAPVRQDIRASMLEAAEKLAFEQAQQYKTHLALLEDYQGKSMMVSTTLGDVDVYHIASDERFACISYLQVRDGAVVHTFNLNWTKPIETEDQSLLEMGIVDIEERFNSRPPEIFAPFELTLPRAEAKLTLPKIGDKAKLLELAEKNAKYQLLQQRKQAMSRSEKQTPAERVLRTLQADLQMEQIPIHIECFDNSNIGGSFPVSACVVFKNAKPAKSEYRHYNVKTVEGPNDFATMEEVVYRRYRRLLDEEKPLPQLVIIDGGKGQLSSAMKSLEKLGIENKMTVVGIAKQLEEIFFPNDSVPLYIDKKSESLKVIQHARNEAHRFGITFHRNQRSKNFTQTELTDITGIGEKTAEKLLSVFGSVTQVRQKTATELAKEVGQAAAERIFFYFHPTEKADNQSIATTEVAQDPNPTDGQK